ncbi:putative conserved lipoprotein LppM [Williamsia phyllosphaerae]|uniref:Conserved lipoprotein LppM n=2 Tax=Williamsia phyllosphaerae TaxID=885042 RepID=A0ABQ1UZP0_9NOCA|nr:putative conserved lipoprotein LppM [Williamsia phyllosphaerae]
MPPAWHDVPVLGMRSASQKRSPSTNRGLRVVLATLIAALCTLALSSCMDRSPYVGDRLWGDLVVAEKSTGQGQSGKGPQIEVPQSMAGSVVAEEYDENGMVGTRVTYTALPVGQFNQLGDLLLEAYPNSAVSLQLTTKRSGDVVRFRGNADLASLTPGQDLLELTVQFAGGISATNGTQSADDTVTWKPEAGKVSDLTAEATYADPGTAAFGDWTWVLAGLTLAVVLIVGGIAYLARDTSPRPGAPAERR